MISIIWHDTETEMIIDETIIDGLRMWISNPLAIGLPLGEPIMQLAYIKLHPKQSTTEIAESLGISRSKVSRLRKKYSETLSAQHPFLMVLDSKGRDSIPEATQPSVTTVTLPSPKSLPVATKEVATIPRAPRVGINQKPSVGEVQSYMIALLPARHDRVREAECFMDHYDACGWVVGKNKPMKDWKAAVRQWIRRSGQFANGDNGTTIEKKRDPVTVQSWCYNCSEWFSEVPRDDVSEGSDEIGWLCTGCRRGSSSAEDASESTQT